MRNQSCCPTQRTALNGSVNKMINDAQCAKKPAARGTVHQVHCLRGAWYRWINDAVLNILHELLSELCMRRQWCVVLKESFSLSAQNQLHKRIKINTFVKLKHE